MLANTVKELSKGNKKALQISENGCNDSSNIYKSNNLEKKLI